MNDRLRQLRDLSPCPPSKSGQGIQESRHFKAQRGVHRLRQVPFPQIESVIHRAGGVEFSTAGWYSQQVAIRQGKYEIFCPVVVAKQGTLWYSQKVAV
jgi:hypothetical protein